MFKYENLQYLFRIIVTLYIYWGFHITNLAILLYKFKTFFGKFQRVQKTKKTLIFFFSNISEVFESFIGQREKLEMCFYAKFKHSFHIIVAFLTYIWFHIRSLAAIYIILKPFTVNTNVNKYRKDIFHFSSAVI